MQEFIIGPNDADQRLDKYLQKLLKKAPQSLIQKSLRKKNIVLNGKKAEGITKTKEGDVIKIFMTDDTLALFRDLNNDEKQKTVKKNNSYGKVDIIYSDSQVLVVNKPKGLLSQKATKTDTSLVDFVIDYAKQKKILTSKDLETFSPGICNRLDRNTSGLVLAGLSLKALQSFNEKIKAHEIKKYYACIVKGTVNKPMHVIADWVKNEKTNTVTITNSVSVSMKKEPLRADDTKGLIETRFWPLCSQNGFTLLQVELLTGKTHQIRAQMEALGIPLVGEKKYQGNKDKNEKEPASQMLHSWIMILPKLSGELSYLSDKRWEAPLPKAFLDYFKESDIKKCQHGLQED